MARAKLTQRAVEAAHPQAAPYELRDTDLTGFVLRVQPSGVKSFIVQWARGKRRTLGKYPALTATAARTQALAILSDAAQHGTPEVAKPRPKTTTLRAFVDEAFRPWAQANLRQGDVEADRIVSMFAEFADKPLTAINAWTVEKWRAKRIKAGVQTSTCNRNLAMLKSALNRACKWGMLDAHPLASVKQSKVDNARVRYLSKDENKRLRAALAARDAKTDGVHVFADHLTPAVLLSVNTGLRHGELVALTWEDVNLPGKMLTVRAATAKSGKTRHIPLNAEALAVLKQWKRQQPEGRLFPFNSFKTAWGTLMKDASIENFRWHDLRHTFASNLVMAGVDLNTVRELLGHADLKMTLRYAHLAPEHKAAAVALLGGGK
ncbi:MAG: Phage integrase [Rhodanobacteraceae bacterium]|jgi:integrase|nr:MAG: Phage integrase [Rhodanobacteraceae bacterium]